MMLSAAASMDELLAISKGSVESALDVMEEGVPLILFLLPMLEFVLYTIMLAVHVLVYLEYG